MAIFFPLAVPYLNMAPMAKAIVGVMWFAQWVNKVRNSWIFNFHWKAGTWIHGCHTLSVCFWGFFYNCTYCEEVTPGEVFSQPFTHFFGPTPPAFKGFRYSQNANDIVEWLVLLIGLFCLAFRDKVRLPWVTTNIYPRA